MKRLLLSTLLSATLSTGANAFDVTAMSDAERQAFRTEIRNYLLENPEILIEVSNVLEQRQQAQQTNSDFNLVQMNSQDLFDDGFSYVGGNPNGDITIVEFLDYKCGYCKKAHPDVAKLINGDGNIRYIVKEFPILGEQSVLASRFAISTRQILGSDVYAVVHDNLMTFRGDITETSLRRLTDQLSIDGDAIFANMNSDAVNREISLTRELGQRMKINGTPSFVMGETMLRGYVPYDSMVQILGEIRGG